MWAVGRLSLLSRGRTAVPPKLNKPLAPVPTAVTPTAVPSETALSTSMPSAARKEAKPSLPGLLQRIVLRVKGLFRPFFG